MHRKCIFIIQESVRCLCSCIENEYVLMAGLINTSEYIFLDFDLNVVYLKEIYERVKKTQA